MPKNRRRSERICTLEWERRILVNPTAGNPANDFWEHPIHENRKTSQDHQLRRPISIFANLEFTKNLHSKKSQETIRNQKN